MAAGAEGEATAVARRVHGPAFALAYSLELSRIDRVLEPSEQVAAVTWASHKGLGIGAFAVSQQRCLYAPRRGRVVRAVSGEAQVDSLEFGDGLRISRAAQTRHGTAIVFKSEGRQLEFLFGRTYGGREMVELIFSHSMESRGRTGGIRVLESEPL